MAFEKRLLFVRLVLMVIVGSSFSFQAATQAAAQTPDNDNSLKPPAEAGQSGPLDNDWQGFEIKFLKSLQCGATDMKINSGHPVYNCGKYVTYRLTCEITVSRADPGFSLPAPVALTSIDIGRPERDPEIIPVILDFGSSLDNSGEVDLFCYSRDKHIPVLGEIRETLKDTAIIGRNAESIRVPKSNQEISSDQWAADKRCYGEFSVGEKIQLAKLIAKDAAYSLLNFVDTSPAGIDGIPSDCGDAQLKVFNEKRYRELIFGADGNVRFHASKPQ